MYSIDSLDQIREFEAFLFEGPEKTEHSFDLEGFHNTVQSKKRDPSLQEQIRKERENLPISENLRISFNEMKELIVKKEVSL